MVFQQFPDGTNQPSAARSPIEEASANQLVWIVILHWQASHYTRACLASLSSLRYRHFQVLLVDNGSIDNAGSSIAKQFPGISLLRLEENQGFAGGCNAGMRYCLEQGAQWIWLLNNDAKVTPESLGLLMAAANSHEQVGALGAMVFEGAGQQSAAAGPGTIDFWRAKTFLRKQLPQNDQPVSCQWLSGSNLLLKAAALKQCGLFDEDYFLYFEDTDLCYRLVRCGWQCLLVPAARVEHVGGGSTEGGRSFWRAYYFTRNRLLFFCKHLGGLQALPALIAIGGHLARHALVLPFRGQSGRKQLKAEYLGLRDYLHHRLGKATCLDWCES